MPRYEVIADELKVRKEPSTEAEVLTVLPKGTPVIASTVETPFGEYHFVELEEPWQVGYVAKEFLTEATSIKMITTAAIHRRQAPSIHAGWDEVIPAGTTIVVYSGLVIENQYIWRPTDGGFVDAEYLSTVVTPPPPPPAPVLDHNRLIGFHCHLGTPKAELVVAAQELHAAGKPIGGCVVIDDADLANELYDAGVRVVLRRQDGENDPTPFVPQNEPEAIQAGISWVAERWTVAFNTARLGIYGQITNEWGDDNPFIYAFWIGVMIGFERVGRHACICNYAVGHPSGDDWKLKWARHLPAFQHAVAHGHIVGLHAYGNNNHPNLGISDPASAYFAYRHEEVWNAMPANARPPLAITECGPYNAGIPNGGVLNDMIGYSKGLARDSYVLFLAYWTLSQPQLTGWEGFNSDLGDIIAYLKGN